MCFNHPRRVRRRDTLAAFATLLCSIGLPGAQAQAILGLSKPLGLTRPPLLERVTPVARITVVGNTHVATADIIARLNQKADNPKSTDPKAGATSAAVGGLDDGAALVNVAAVRDMGVFQSVQVTTRRRTSSPRCG